MMHLLKIIGMGFCLCLANCTPKQEIAQQKNETPLEVQKIEQEEIEVIKTAEYKVGLLVPLTGAGSDIGQAMLNAAQMAIYDNRPQDFVIIPQDSGAKPEQIGHATQRLVEAHVDVILGPLYGNTVPVVATKAGTIPVFTFSNDLRVAQPNVHVLGLSPQDQVMRVVDYAKKEGYTNCIGFLPHTTYGKLVGEALLKATQPEQVIYYTPEDLHEKMGMLVGLLKGEKTAILFADSPSQMQSILPQLQNLDHIKILGTGIWDEPDVFEVAPLLQHAWFAAPYERLRLEFNQKYKALYHQDPPRVATLAYDSVGLLGTRNLEETYIGIDGPLRVTPDGTVQRDLAVLEITPQGNKIQNE